MTKRSGDRKTRPIPEAILWGLVVIYTFLLPSFLIIYRAILNTYGKEIVGRVPLFIVAIFGIGYVTAVLRTRKDPKYLLYLIPCGIIAGLIMRLEPNPNKHIHIPQYIVMAWLLFTVLSRNYKGRGILILIFFYASLLGLVDELEQGIHPSRFYGWTDMLVNSSSSIIGIFTILGLKKVDPGNWEWTAYLRKYKELILLTLVGMAGAAAMLITLFQVQAAEAFEGVYPGWLQIWNFGFVILAPLAVIILPKISHSLNKSGLTQPASSGERTARLWVYPLLATLWYMHFLLVFVRFCNIPFR